MMRIWARSLTFTKLLLPVCPSSLDQSRTQGTEISVMHDLFQSQFKGLRLSRYIEVDVYRKPKLLLDINPRGLVPALRHGDWGCYESTVLMEYLEDLDSGRALLPADAQSRARARLWSDHINRHVIPAFYKYLQAQEADNQVKFAGELKGHISTLVDAADERGPFFFGEEIGFVDVQLAPWLIRLEKVLKPYRGMSTSVSQSWLPSE